MTGLFGMALAGLSRGKISLAGSHKTSKQQIGSLGEHHRLTSTQLAAIRKDAEARNISFHDALMNARGWPEIECDGKLLVSHQDALLMGGKVQAASGYADHVTFTDPQLCRECEVQTCVEMCSGQAITRGDGVPAFDREKCVYCGACLWNCAEANIEFHAGTGGLHSAEN